MTDADTSPEAVNLHDTTDAAVWAKEFCKNWPTALCQVPGREGVESEDDFEAIMIGWFANAIMAGVDSEHHALSARVQELEADLEEANELVTQVMMENVALQDGLIPEQDQ